MDELKNRFESSVAEPDPLTFAEAGEVKEIIHIGNARYVSQSGGPNRIGFFPGPLKNHAAPQY
jgi:hypothetical protein